MNIYIVVISDRHSDDSLEPFLDKDKALARAKSATAEMMEHYHVNEDEINSTLNSDMTSSSWLYYASLEDAGSVRVEEKIIA